MLLAYEMNPNTKVKGRSESDHPLADSEKTLTRAMPRAGDAKNSPAVGDK